MDTSQDLVELFLNDRLEYKKDKFPVVIDALDHYLVLFKAVFVRARYFELGLTFYDICLQEIEANRDKIEDWKYDRYQEYLIDLKLEMLDYLNEWDEYIAFSNWVIENVKMPYTFNRPEYIDKRYFYNNDSDGEQIHFLLRQSDRYEIITRKIERRKCGKSIDHLKRHQQVELTYDQIEYRYNMVLQFFYDLNKAVL